MEPGTIHKPVHGSIHKPIMMFDQKYLPIKESRKYFIENNLDTDIFDIDIPEIKKQLFNKYGENGEKKARGVCKGLIIDRMEKNSLLEGFIMKYWAYGNTDDGKMRIQKYKKAYHEYEAVFGWSQAPTYGRSQAPATGC